MFFSAGEVVSGVVDLGCAAMMLPEPPTIKAAATLLSSTLQSAAEYPIAADTLGARGERLAHTIMAGVGGAVARSSLKEFSIVLYELSRVWTQPLNDLLRTLLAHEGFPSPLASAAVKDAFLRKLPTLLGSRSKFIVHVEEFSLVCRGLQESEFARM